MIWIEASVLRIYWFGSIFRTALHCSAKKPPRSLHQKKEVANAAYLLIHRNFFCNNSLSQGRNINLACNLPDLTEMTHWDWAVYIKTSMQYHIGLQFAWPNSLLPDAQGNWRSDSNLCFLKTCKVDLVILHSTLPLICCMSLTRLYLYYLSIKITLGPDTRHKTHKTWKVDLHSTLSYTCLITFIGTLKQLNWNTLRRLQFVWNCDIHDEIGSHRASFSENKFGVSGSRLYICISIKITLEQALLGTYITLPLPFMTKP